MVGLIGQYFRKYESHVNTVTSIMCVPFYQMSILSAFHELKKFSSEYIKYNCEIEDV